MFDLKELMNNDTIKGIMAKVGVSEEQASSVINTAASTMKNKFSGNEAQASSLLSENENTADDNKLAEEVEEGFLSKLSADDDGIINKLKGAAMPAIMSVMSSKMAGNKKGGTSGITSMLSGFIDDKDGDGIGMNDIMDSAKSKLGGLFGK